MGREDGATVGPISVPDRAALALMIANLAPPLVTIRSVTGENVEVLKGLVEKAKAGGALH